QTAYQAINQQLSDMHFNRCISTLMIAVNELRDSPLSASEQEILIKLFAPFFPHFAEEIWSQLGHTTSIFAATWPELTVSASQTVTYVIQLNGKVRGTLVLDRSLTED